MHSIAALNILSTTTWIGSKS